MTNPVKETVPTEAVVELSPDATPFKNTTVGKTTRTLFQNIVGAVAVTIPVLLASDDVRRFVAENPNMAWIPVALALAGALVTYIQNSIENHAISE